MKLTLSLSLSLSLSEFFPKVYKFYNNKKNQRTARRSQSIQNTAVPFCISVLFSKKPPLNVNIQARRPCACRSSRMVSPPLTANGRRLVGNTQEREGME